jgi:aspartate/methionine/tyrosine aminotransferase
MTDRIARRLEDFDSGKIRLAFELATEIPNQIDLSIGFPEEDTPEEIKQAGIAAIQNNHTKYLPTNGLAELRQAIARKLYTENKIAADAENITVTPGLTTAILLCYLAILNPGDEVIVPQPLFPPYFELAKIAGAVPVPLSTFPDFQLTAAALSQKITPRTKAIVINSPNNPTGAIYDKAELIKIAELAKLHEIIIISDEIYEYFSYDKPHFSIGSIYENTLTLNGFSKAYGMTGWRIGYICGPLDIVEAINQLQQYVVFSSSSIAQYAALEALKTSQLHLREKYKAKRDLALGVLSKTFPGIHGGSGAFYLFIKLPGGLEDVKVVNQLSHSGVIVLPGSAFSDNNGYIRISFAGDIDSLKTGLERVNKSIETLLQNRPPISGA